MCVPREQRSHDLEHRARYKALRERWEVLDRLMGPQESDHLAFYLELSDDEACDMHTNQLHVQLKKNLKVCVCVCCVCVVCVLRVCVAMCCGCVGMCDVWVVWVYV